MTVLLTDVFNQELSLRDDHQDGWVISTPNDEADHRGMLWVQSPDDQDAIAHNLIVEAGFAWISLTTFLQQTGTLGGWSWPVRMTKKNWASYMDPNNYSDEA